MFDHCVARIVLSWNDNVSSAYRSAFAEEHKQGRKQLEFALKNASHFVLKLIFRKVESLTLKFIFYYTVLQCFSTGCIVHPTVYQIF